jgi:hypothetical protein
MERSPCLCIEATVSAVYQFCVTNDKIDRRTNVYGRVGEDGEGGRGEGGGGGGTKGAFDLR